MPFICGCNFINVQVFLYTKMTVFPQIFAVLKRQYWRNSTEAVMHFWVVTLGECERMGIIGMASSIWRYFRMLSCSCSCQFTLSIKKIFQNERVSLCVSQDGLGDILFILPYVFGIDTLAQICADTKI